MCKKHDTPCLNCGKPFRPIKGKASIYCSQSCYWEYMRTTDAYKRGSIHKPTCCHCGEIAEGRAPSRNRSGKRCTKVFCSRDCYDASRAEAIKQRRKPCEHCGKSFDPGGEKSKRKYCSHDCRVNSKRGQPKHCVNCGCWFSAVKTIMRPHGMTIISVNGTKTCSPECHNQWIRNNPTRKKKISKAFTAEKHPNWQGGTHKMGSRGPGWQKIAERCRALHGRKCKQCGMTEDESVARNWGRLQVNHIIPFHQWINKRKANAQSNLEALCKSCHTKTDWKWRKENPVQQVMNLFE